MDHNHFMRLAYLNALESPDPSTQTGAVIVDEATKEVLGEGCNEFPAGVLYRDERLERPLKYQYIEHAERNAIFDMVRHARNCQDDLLVMYALWAACADCARAIVQSGIRKLYTHSFYISDEHENWDASIKVAMDIFSEGGVSVVFLDDPVMKDGETLRYNGKPVHY